METQADNLEASPPTARESDKPSGADTPSNPKDRDRLFRSLLAACTALVILTIAMAAWALNLNASRSDERATADRTIRLLKEDIDDLEGDLAAEKSAVESGEQALEDSMATVADTSSRLEQARSEIRSLNRLFPIDLQDLEAVQPTGRFTMSTDIEDCTGWNGCDEEVWVDRFPSLTISCGATCSVEALTDESAELTFSSRAGTWSASGSFPAFCEGEDADGEWSLEIRPAGLTLDGGAMAIEQFTGTLEVKADPVATCRAASISYDLEADRR